MALKLVLDPGTEFLLPFAKNKLAQIKATKASSFQSVSKIIEASSGERIEINSLQAFDMIRITGGDGYYSLGVINGVTTIAGKHNYKGKFKKRGATDGDVDLLVPQLAYTGGGIALVSVNVPGSDISFALTRNGGKKISPFFTTIAENISGTSSRAQTLAVGVDLVAGKTTSSSATFAVYFDATDSRYYPYFVYADAKAGTAYPVVLPRLDGSDHLHARPVAFSPTKWFIALPVIGDAPFFLLSTDRGENWVEVDSSAFRLDLHSSEIGDVTATDRLAVSLSFAPLNATKLLMLSEYKDGASVTRVRLHTIDTVADTFTLTYTFGSEVTDAGINIFGRDTFGVRYTDTTASGEALLLSFDGGLSWSPAGAPPSTAASYVGAITRISPYQSAGQPGIFLLPIYDGEYSLYATTDGFVSWEKVARIHDLTDPPPFGSVLQRFGVLSWIGVPGKPAPVDPVYPWVSDVRISPPEWWL